MIMFGARQESRLRGFRSLALVVTGALISAGVGFSVLGAANAAAPTGTISVDFTHPIAASPAKNFGYTFSTFASDGGPTVGKPADIAALRALGAGTIRLHLKPGPNGTTVSGALGGVPGITGEQWVTTAEQLGVSPTVIVNTDINDAVGVLNSLNANGHHVTRFLIGNEMDANSRSNITIEEYTVKFKQIAAAMRAITPGLEIGGPSSAWFNTGLLQTFINGAVTNALPQEKASFIDYHAYGAGTGTNATFAQSMQFTNQIIQLRRMINDPSVGIEIGEFNMNWGAESQNNTHFASVWNANAFGTIISQGAIGLLYADKNTQLGLIGPNGVPKAAYIGMEMFTGQPNGLRRFGDTVVQSTSSDANIHVYASANSNNIVVINAGGATSTRINMTGVGAGTVEKWQSAGDVATIHSPVQFGNTPFSNGTFTTSLPSMSITTFVVRPTVPPATPGNSWLPSLGSGHWLQQGTATKSGSVGTLTTPLQQFAAGSIYNDTPVNSTNLHIAFDAVSSGGNGADGMTLSLLDPSSRARLGSSGGGLGYSGLTGVAVTMDTFDNVANRADHLIGIATSGTGSNLTYLASSTAVTNLRVLHHYDVNVIGGTLAVSVDGRPVVGNAVSLPSKVIVAFTAGTGASTDLHQVSNVFVATALPDFTDSRWRRYGTATTSGTSATLTTAAQQLSAGSVVYSTPKQSEGIQVIFDSFLGGGNGSEGLALVFIDPNSTARVGGSGAGLGYSGLKGVAVTLDTHQSGNDPSSNFVGIAKAGSGEVITYAATTTNIPSLRGVSHHFIVTTGGGRLVVNMDGSVILNQAVALPSNALVGFTGSTGVATDLHQVSNVVVATR